MAEVFESARALVRALRESNENRNLKRLAARMKADAQLESLLLDFRLRQLEVQAAGLQGKPATREQQESLALLAKKVESQPMLREYLNAELAYGRILAEVQKVLAEAFNLDLPGMPKPKGH